MANTPEVGLRDRGLVVAAGLAASLPVIVAVVRTLQEHWVPLADDGVIVLRAWDVLTDQSPLVGQFSTAKAETVGNVYSPGPLLYWLLALPVRAFGWSAAPVTIGAMNVASIMGSVALSRRRAGTAFMLVTALALALMCRSLPAESLSMPFNPTAPLLPCTLLVFLTWSLACGEYRLLPVTALVASFVMQTHLSYVGPAVGMLAIGGIGLFLSRRGAEPGARNWALAAVAVAAVSWSAPLIDEVVHEPGNLTQLRRTLTADRATLGADTGWHAIVKAFGAPPWWLESQVSGQEHLTDLIGPPSRASVLAFLTVVGLLAVGLAQWRHPATVVAAGLGVLLVGGLAVVAAVTPAERVITLGYTMQWGSPAGMFAWLAAGLGLLGAIVEASRRAGVERGAPVARRAGALVGLAVVAVVASWAASADSPNSQRWIYDPARATVAELETALPPGRSVFVAPSTGEVGYQAYPLIVFALRRHGDRPLVVDSTVETVGPYYAVAGRSYDSSVVLVEGNAPVPEGGRVVARIPVEDAPATVTDHQLSVVLVP
jgi:hypothetical protein